MIIIVYCLTKASIWDWSKIQLRINIASFPTSLGIIVFSYTSQIFLPTLENNMRHPTQFNAMLILSHVVAAIFKTGFALIGFLTWQEQTSEVITNNLPTQELRIIINLTLAIKALLSYPLPYFAACELILPKFSLSNDMKTWKTILARIIIILSTLIMALCIPHFAQLMGFIGSITGVFLSLIWPCYFYLYLKNYSLSWTTICGNLAIIIFGFMCTISGIIDSSRELARKFRE
jgi:vesicular inhibitory amino acid transporter